MALRDHKQEILELLERGSHKVGECFVYGNTSNYVKILFNNKYYAVHRLSAHLYHNLDINDIKSLALHKNECRFKNCWNPIHLYVGNYDDNMSDWVDIPNRRNANREKTHCNNGHELSGKNVRIESRSGARRCKECHNIASRKFRNK